MRSWLDRHFLNGGDLVPYAACNINFDAQARLRGIGWLGIACRYWGQNLSFNVLSKKPGISRGWLM